MDDIYISAGWGPRRETLSRCAERLCRFLTALSKEGKLFSKWYRTINRKNEAKREVDFRNIEELSRILKPHTGDPRHELGYIGGLWNGDWLGVGLTVVCGQCTTHPGLGNDVVVDLPRNLGKLKNPKKLADTLATIVRAWEPEDGGVISSSSRDKRDLDTEVPFVDWIFYGSKKLYRFDSVPSEVSSFPVDNLGTILVLRDRPVDYGNPEDFRLIRSVEKAIGIDSVRQLHKEKMQRFMERAKRSEERRRMRINEDDEFTPPPAGI